MFIALAHRGSVQSRALPWRSIYTTKQCRYCSIVRASYSEMSGVLGPEGEQGRGRKRGSKTGGSGNIRESMGYPFPPIFSRCLPFLSFLGSPSSSVLLMQLLTVEKIEDTHI